MTELVTGDVHWDGRTHSYRPGPDWREYVESRIPLHIQADEDLDPITFEVIRQRLWTINMAHGDTVTHVSGSPVFASLDFNMMILTEDAEVVLNAPFMQFLNAGAPQGIRYIMSHFAENPGINEGDVFVANDPWVGAVHQMDVLVAAPVYVDGELFGWTSNAGHQYDLGGLVPGGWPQNAVDVYSDPVVLTPFKLIEAGVMRPDLERMYLRHSRQPDLVALDLRAQVAGVRFARDSIVELCNRFGAGVVKAAMRRILDSAQRGFREKLKLIPDGIFSEVRYVDENLPGDRGTYRVQINLRKTGDRLVIDNEGTVAQGDGPIGIVFNGFAGSVFGVLNTSMLYEQLFAFGGAGRQIDYEPTPGLITCVDHPAACSAGILNVVTHMGAVQTCINRMLATDPELKSDIVAAAPDYPVPVIAGKDDRGNGYGQAVLDHMAMGSGARSFGDGVDTGGPTWSPLTFLLNAEAVEQWYPMVYLYRRELTDSGGAGRWRGGVGLKYAWTPYRAESMDMVTFSGGMCMSTHSSEGVFGGYPSPPAHVKVRRSTNLQELFSTGQIPASLEDVEAVEDIRIRGKSNGIELVAGDIVEATIVGGGGYGDPLRREPQRVAADVAVGAVSTHAAHDLYGVVFDESGEVDAQGTEELRAELLDARRSWTPVQARETEQSAATGEADRSVHEYLVARDVDGDRKLACSSCGHVVSGFRDAYKSGLVSRDTDLGDLPGFIDPALMIDVPFTLRQYACPGCGTLMASEVVAVSEDPLDEVRFA